jgi:hypothetical protein
MKYLSFTLSPYKDFMVCIYGHAKARDFTVVAAESEKLASALSVLPSSLNALRKLVRQQQTQGPMIIPLGPCG